jgi:hypothetical protein
MKDTMNLRQIGLQADNVTRNRVRAEDSQLRNRATRVLQCTRLLPAFRAAVDWHVVSFLFGLIVRKRLSKRMLTSILDFKFLESRDGEALLGAAVAGLV